MHLVAKGLCSVVLGTFAVTGCGDSSKSGDGSASAGQSSGGSSAGLGASGRSGAADTEGGSGTSSAGAGAVSGDRGGEGGARSGAAGMSAASGAAGSGAGSGADGSTPSADCSGQFGAPRVVLDSGPELRVYSPTLSDDELELLYSATDVPRAVKGFRRSTRSSKLAPFEPGAPLPELDAACAPTEDRTSDLSSDGLRAYIGCYDPTVSFSGPLRIARRSAPGAAFVLDAQSYGTVGASPAISANELIVYTSGFNASADPGLVYERAAPDAPFDHGSEIPGLGGVPTQAPDLSINGLALFFGNQYGVWVATRQRPDLPFSTPAAVIAPPTDAPATSWMSPAISDDCRSLYAVRYVADTGAGDSSWTLEVLTR